MNPKRECLDAFEQRVLPMLSDGRPGHVWTGRLELQGLIERLEDYIASGPACLIKRGEAVELRDYFKSLPHARYSFEECAAALKAETARWTSKTPAM